MSTIDTPVRTTAVTKADIAEIRRAVKQANVGGARFALIAEVRHTDGDRVGTLIVHEVVDQSDGYSPSTVTRTYDIGTEVRMDIYRSYTTRRIVASQSIYRTSIGAAHSLAKVLREGDVLQTFWLIGNDNEHLRAAGLTHDTCTIRVYRRGGFVVEIPLDDTITRTDGYIVGFEDRSWFS